jgi:hypothetical protein
MLKKGILFIAIVLISGIVVLIMADMVLQYGFRRSGEDVIGKMNTLIHDTTYYDIFCLGSSRTLAHIDPILIERKTGLKTYNAGFNGATVFDFKIFLNTFLEDRRAPKLVVIHIDDVTLQKNVTAELPKFFPYISNDHVYFGLVDREPSVWYVRKLPFLRVMYYDDLMKWVAIKSIAGLKPRSAYALRNGFVNSLTGESHWKGYWESKLPERYREIRLPYEPGDSLDEGISTLRSIMDTCMQKKIRVLFTSSPIIGGDEYEKYIKVIRLVEQSAAVYQPGFYWQHTVQLDRKYYFYDHLHMTYRGAEEYSSRLAEQCEQMLK